MTELEALDKRGFAVAVNYATLCEAYTLILRRLGGEYARQWLAEVFDGALLLNPEPQDYQLACGRLDRFADHPITLVDAVLAEMSLRLGARIWSFDRHFVTMRTKVWHPHP